MSSGMIISLDALLMLVGFALSALYSGIETGIYVLNPVRMRLRAATAEPAALRLQSEIAHPGRTLAVVLIGTNAANYLGSYGLAQMLDRSGLGDTWIIVVQVALFTPMLFILAETLPKELFRVHSDAWTYRLVWFLVASRRLMTALLLLPIVRSVAVVAERLVLAEERDVIEPRRNVAELLREGVGAGVLSAEQTTLADRALALRDRPVAEVMVPWSQVVTLPLEVDRPRRAALLRGRRHSRLPVVDRTGAVVGVLHWLDVHLRPDAPTAELVRPATFVPPDASLLAALSALRRSGAGLAFVRPEGAVRPTGLVSLKNIVEQLTGEFRAW